MDDRTALWHREIGQVTRVDDRAEFGPRDRFARALRRRLAGLTASPAGAADALPMPSFATSINILGEAKNGDTVWLQTDGGFVAGRYVDQAA